jgi:uncharacterized repeat protein (TIGR01451 family)
VPESLRPSPVPCHFFISIFRSSVAILVWVFAIIVLSGVLTKAGAQSRPADPQSVDSGAPGQSQPGEGQQGQASPVADSAQPQGFVHIVPFGKVSSQAKTEFAPAGAHLTYFGGPVISNVHVIAVFWGPNINPAITAGIGQFFTDITSSRYYDLLSEYNTTGIIGAAVPAISSNQVIGHGQFDGGITITPSICPGPTACTISDAQIAAELASQVAAGHLPQPLSDNQGNINSFYMVYFPPGVTITLGTARSCVQFCAYHSNTPSTALLPKLVPYGVEPDFVPPSGCANGCGGNAAMFDNVTEVTSHELFEAVTDALVGSVVGNTPVPPLAWYDFPPDLGEISDLCVGQGATVPAGNTTYVIQKAFSNLQGDCVSAPPVFDLTAPAAGAGPSLPFNVTLAIEGSTNPGPLVGYKGTVHFTSSDPQAILPADYTFVPGSDAGAHVFSFTFKTLGNQTITVVDTHSAGFTGTTTVNVNTTPDVTIAKSHTGNFAIGQTGAVYTITVSNVGRGPTSGSVTVIDTLPVGLTATAISGTGWSCTLGPPLTCARGDALAAASSYPPITLTVNVAADAPPLVINTATVSGGGETNTANDLANDPTTIAAPDLVVFKSHFGPINGNFFQGETGATYTISVQNFGILATTGTVTVTDSLPAPLTATAISGTGWSCTLGNLTCTRSDVLGILNSYPPITITVDVPLGAPSSVINGATVSGGGEVNTSNDTSQDPTTILPPPHPDLAPFMNHSVNNFVQGQTGGFYRIDITNVGTATTSGAVTVSDTLPTGLTATDVSGIGWTCTVGATSTCTQSTPLVINDSYAPIFITVAIAANAPTSVVNTVTVSGGGDTNNANNSFSDPTSIAAPLVDLSPSVAGNAFQAQGDTGINYTILINNNGNVSSSGTMTAVTTLSSGLTASAISGTGWTCTLSTLTCTRSDALIPFGVFTLNVTVNFAKNAPATGSVSETVSGGGDGNSANNTNSEGVIIQPMLSIGSVGPQTVNAGTPAIYLLNVNPLTIAGPAIMSCSGLPTASTCTFNPATVPAGVGGVGVSLTLNTTARTATVTDLRSGPRNYRPLFPLFLLVTAVLAAISMHRLGQGRRLKPALALAGLLLLAALSGCGGGGGQGPPIVQNPQGTPAGTYTVTVTATSPNASASTPVTLIVK